MSPTSKMFCTMLRSLDGGGRGGERVGGGGNPREGRGNAPGGQGPGKTVLKKLSGETV